MARHSGLLGIVVLVGLVLLASSYAYAASGAIVGKVRDGQERPIPGLSVYVVVGQVRMGPAITQDDGKFFFANVPTNITGYNLQVFWGKKLKFQGWVPYMGGIADAGTIVLK